MTELSPGTIRAILRQERIAALNDVMAELWDVMRRKDLQPNTFESGVIFSHGRVAFLLELALKETDIQEKKT